MNRQPDAGARRDSEPAPELRREFVPEHECNGFYMDRDGKVHPPDSDPAMLSPVLPNNGKPVLDTVILVNGIVTDARLHHADMQMLANTGAAVIGIRNSTAGRIGDIIEYFSDKFRLAASVPVQTIATLLRGAVFEGKPLHLVGHSQGALMISRALELVRDEWMKLNGEGKEQAADRFAHIRIETYGGAAFNYVDGPQYVHVHNVLDPVSQFLGIGAVGGLFKWAAHPGRDARVYSLCEVNTGPQRGVGAPSIVDKLVHGPQAIYFKHRVDFAAARRGEFPAGRKHDTQQDSKEDQE